MTLPEYFDLIRHKRIDVIGAGVSNRPLAEMLLSEGCDVTLRDKKTEDELAGAVADCKKRGAKLKLGPGYLDGLDGDIIFRTPGLHPHTPELVGAKDNGSVITSEMELFLKLCPCKTICVTGSNGKTTTAFMIAELLRHAGLRVRLGGNTGKPLLADTVNISPDDYVVAELSSFQLHSMRCRPDIAVITNISPNHLDVHPDFDDYIGAKSMIFKNQLSRDMLVLNAEDPHSSVFASSARSRLLYFGLKHPPGDGVFLSDGKIYRSIDGRREFILNESELLLSGLHNRENFMAALAAVGDLVGADTCRQVAASFKGVEHRLETVRAFCGVTYINDSIATSPSRTVAGLRAFETKPVLIAGGYDKLLPFDDLGDEIALRASALFLTGDTAQKIKAAVEKSTFYHPEKLPIAVIGDFEEAVSAACRFAKEGDTVLLSPACASFDMFENFEKRGEAFKKIINGLERSHEFV